MYNHALDTFRVAADSGSFSKAAELLYITHTAVIKQINGLELHLGVKLFKRSSQGVVLTAAGQCLYKKTEEIRAFSDKAIQEVQEAYLAAPKTIRIGSSVLYPCTIFMELWDTISDLCPQYQLKIVPIENEERRLAELGDNYDCVTGAYNSEIAGAKCHFIPLGVYRFCLALPRKHRLAKEKKLSLADLDGETLLLMKRGNSEINDQIRQEILDKYSGVIIRDIPPHYSMDTFNIPLETGGILLSLNCWKDMHPGLITIPMKEKYTLPYGIVTAEKPQNDIDDFVHAVKNTLLKK